MAASANSAIPPKQRFSACDVLNAWQARELKPGLRYVLSDEWD